MMGRNSYNILIVESDPETRFLVRTVLRRERIGEILAVETAAQALEAINRFMPDVLVIETELDNGAGEGVDFIRRIRAGSTPLAALTPVVAVTDKTDSKLLRATVDVGVHGFIVRPASSQTILDQVRNAISNRDSFLHDNSLSVLAKHLRNKAPDPHQPVFEEAEPEEAQTRAAPRRAEPRPVSQPVLKAAPSPKPAPERTAEPVLKAAPSPPPAATPEVAAKPATPPAAKPAPAPAPIVARAPTPVSPAKPAAPAKPASSPQPVAAAKKAVLGIEDMAPARKSNGNAEPAFDPAPMLSEHALWLESGGQQGARALLNGVNMSGRVMREAQLANAKLKDVDLSDADLTDANLEWVDLSGSYLSGAILSGANLHGAKLRRADLSLAIAEATDLRGADLAGASLKGAKLDGADMSNANLLCTELGGTDLQGVEGLSQAQFNKAFPDDDTKVPPHIRRTQEP